jgi:hypothetical protein
LHFTVFVIVDGGSHVIKITAISSNPSLIPDPTVNYTNDDASGSLKRALPLRVTIADRTPAEDHALILLAASTLLRPGRPMNRRCEFTKT